jgi:23S rRNA (pseudouridine1915-N3)-methyltransferase
VNIKEVADEKTPDNASSAEEEIIKNKEGARLLNVLKDDSYKIILAIDGKNLSSPELADKIDKIGLSGKSHIQFVIGGSLGLSDDVIKKADMKLSFGRMTFPHQLMRVILLEQIYRSYRIISNEPYHK